MLTWKVTPAPDQSKWFTGPQWAEVFLPSLSHALYIARNPFDDFKKDSPQFIKTYKFRAGDKFVEKASTLSAVS